MNRMELMRYVRRCASGKCKDCDKVNVRECAEISREAMSYLVQLHEFKGAIVLAPCKIGDIVYVIPTVANGLKEVTKMKCIGFIISSAGEGINLTDEKNKLFQPSFEQFGVSVFSTLRKAKEHYKEEI